MKRDTLIDYDRLKGKPHAFIQWKGTDACMDVYCPCGEQGHVDDYFAYFLRCKFCGRAYETDCHVELYEIKNEARVKEIESEDRFMVFGDTDPDGNETRERPGAVIREDAIDILSELNAAGLIPEAYAKRAWATLRRAGR